MKISIVIPTRERAQYLKHSIQTALEIDDPEIEVVVSDNASLDETRKVVDAINDPRLVYVNTGSRVSMRENFNRAFLASNGDYLIFFGDDDGILPRQFRFLRRLLEQRRPDGISWERCTYGWPIPGYGKKTGGIRLKKENCFGRVSEYSGSDCREDLLSCRLGAMSPHPEIYHGCLSREYLLRTSLDSETIFDGSIPDFCIAYRAILKGGEFLHVNHGFSINGHSPASTGGGQAASQKKNGDDSTSKQFSQENKKDPFIDVIGYAGSVPLAFFSTLETVRERHTLTEFRPNYLAWYRFVLGSSRGNDALRTDLLSVLQPHAAASGSTPELEEAQKLPLPPKRTFGERVTKLRTQLSSFRISANINGENTILTAANAMDAVLGESFGNVLDASETAATAWRATKKRSKQFVREF